MLYDTSHEGYLSGRERERVRMRLTVRIQRDVSYHVLSVCLSE